MSSRSTPPSSAPVLPGKTIGILGGGQLGRMTALAAARLGYRCHVFCPEADCPASLVAAAHTRADYQDESALARFAAAVDVVTLEFENIPLAPVQFLERLVPVRPGAAILAVGQDRVREKTFFGAFAKTAPWRAVNRFDDLTEALAVIGTPSILKTNRFGYDGKGQIKIEAGSDLRQAWTTLQGVPCILEGFISFEREISTIVARGLDGALACYCPAENTHRHHILDTTRAPAPISGSLARQAETVACEAAKRLALVGLLAVEMFVVADGRILVNEMAPRPHNSGHWTQDGCLTDQFEQTVRAVCGLPLGSPARRCDVVMKNLLGEDLLADGDGRDSAEFWRKLLSDPAAKLHLYGKDEARKGRKMGHVNFLPPAL